MGSNYFYSFDSWIKVPRKYTENELFYLSSLEEVWRVKSGSKWVPYKLAPHQVLWHLDDVVLKKHEAPIRVVVKSRNTSFTVSSLISLLTSISEYKNDVIPLTRLNSEKAIDMVNIAKQLIKHMKPIIIEDEGSVIYWPFNPNNVDMKNSKSIKFLDNDGEVVTEIRAFPANADSAESIRGIRTIGHAGILDEVNFMRYFESIYVALRDSTVGKVNGMKIHQFDIGTTLKGNTPFYDWYEKQKKRIGLGKGSRKVTLRFYEWPVFDVKVFNTDIPFHENDQLVSIVNWHDKEDLWEKYLEDDKIFFEEYMGQKVDSDLQFYSTELLLNNHINDTVPLDEIKFSEYDKIVIGIDPASTQDYFAISVFGYNGDQKDELYLNYANKITLNESKNKCRGILNRIHSLNRNWLCTIDATPIGLDLFQTLQKEYGTEYVRGVTGNKRVTVNKDNKIKLNEFGHTLIKKYMNDNVVTFILDELSIKHMQSITYKYAPERDGNGHGDIAMARLYALLPVNLNSVKQKQIKTNISRKEETAGPIHDEDLFSKIKRYRKRRK